ncbi:helix-turn-helix domain-containing protein [Lactococcus lactis]|uniref:helix-turn-helix domain-containing protein n=1 Tax=Lactococcus lactis TaxID=1358 RepID=UPI0024A6C124|nr:helix-turn-helix transcriptional regulator [Lactococcus lactis]
MFYERIQSLVKQSNKSFNQIERELDYPKNALNDYKKGKSPSVTRIVEISKYFNVTTDYLLGITNNPNSTLTQYEVENRFSKSATPKSMELENKKFELLEGELFEIDGFINLGVFRDVDSGEVDFKLKSDYYLIRKIFLVIADNKFFQIILKNPEEIFEFLQEKNWYNEKSTKLLIFQMYSDWMEVDESEVDLWNEFGIHPLEQNETIKEILKSLEFL